MTGYTCYTYVLGLYRAPVSNVQPVACLLDAVIPKINLVRQGLIDFAFDPNFEQNNFFYVSYTAKREEEVSAIALVRGGRYVDF